MYFLNLDPGDVDRSTAVTSLDPHDASDSGGGGTSLTISDCEEILKDAQLGDSICVNGTTTSLSPTINRQLFTTPSCCEVIDLLTLLGFLFRQEHA